MLHHSMLMTRIQIYNQSLSSLRTSSTHPIPLNKATSSFFKARKAIGENFYMKTGLNWMQCVDVSMWGGVLWVYLQKKNAQLFTWTPLDFAHFKQFLSQKKSTLHLYSRWSCFTSTKQIFNDLHPHHGARNAWNEFVSSRPRNQKPGPRKASFDRNKNIGII